MNTIDLHVHSTVSDGTLTPTEIAQLAEKTGLSAFALTDHDSVAGNTEAGKAAAACGLGFIPGMELTTESNDRKLHVVCLGFDADHPAFRQLYHKVRAIKEAAIPEIIAFVRRRGIRDISEEAVKPFAGGRPIDRYAIMRYLVSLNLYDHAQPLWDNYLDPATRALGVNISITAEEAFPLIHRAGGITSLAHFHKKIGLKGCSRAEQEQIILRLHALGLDGMEISYPTYTADDAAFAAAMIRKYKLIATGGTDFHGSNRPDTALGTGIDGNMHVPYELFEKICPLCRKKQEN